jgi:hypothetical protein
VCRSAGRWYRLRSSSPRRPASPGSMPPWEAWASVTSRGRGRGRGPSPAVESVRG